MNTEEEKLTLGAKIGYGLGDFGANLIIQTVTLYIMYFFTDVFLISASWAGIISFVSKIWDAITDPIMGLIADRTKTKWGSKRPYLLFGAIPLGLIFFGMFYSPSLTEGLKVWYALIFFVLLSTAYTVVNVPYGALTANIVLSASERSALTGYRMLFAILATLFTAGATKPLVAVFETEKEGFRYVSSLYGILAILFTWVTFFSVKEKYRVKTQESFHLSDIATILKSNSPFLYLTLGTIFHLGAISIAASMVNYYFKYNMQQENFIPIAFLCLLLSAVISLPFWIWVSKKLEKKHAFNMGMLLFAVSLLPFYFIKEFNYLAFVPVLILAGAGMSTIYLSPWSMIPDTVEYSQHKTGLRREGILYGFFYFGQKLSAALSLLISGVGLEWIGYANPIGTTSTIQSEETLRGILFLQTLAPAALIFIGSYFIWKYPITNQMHKDLVESLQEKGEQNVS